MAQNEIAHLTTLLDLTTAQAAQATIIFTNSLTAINPLRTKLDTDRQTLETAITTNALSIIDQIASVNGDVGGRGGRTLSQAALVNRSLAFPTFARR